MKLDKFIDIFVISAFILLCLAIVVCTTISFVEKPPLIFTNVPFPVEDPCYDVGDSVRMLMGGCSDGIQEYHFTHRLRNLDTGELHFLPDTTVVVPDECGIVKSIPKNLPENLEGGSYRIESTALAKGIIRRFSISVYSETFRVRK